jgi:hypothetical protein
MEYAGSAYFRTWIAIYIGSCEINGNVEVGLHTFLTSVLSYMEVSGQLHFRKLQKQGRATGTGHGGD